ncbi:MAG: thioredoxin family protein [Bacteroidetes bacterium]|nr:thioredoxin family protein [Bacteroidota bacterium]MBU1114878.1 thioredoxin family protein [Bacteroidota bacterium]MBU1798812.1 thioredoxin family protein [Bacteroidota bacterium]
MFKALIILFLLTFTLSAQEMNKIIIEKKSEKPMLIGLCDREAFADSNFSWWFNSAYNFYEPKKIIVEDLLKFNNNFTLTIVMGTWCSDSRKQVPSFYKLLDELNYPQEKITLINVDRNKETNDVDVSKLNIELVPTFIVYNNGKDIGRIIESPIESLESDLLKILQNYSKE